MVDKKHVYRHNVIMNYENVTESTKASLFEQAARPSADVSSQGKRNRE